MKFFSKYKFDLPYLLILIFPFIDIGTMYLLKDNHNTTFYLFYQLIICGSFFIGDFSNFDKKQFTPLILSGLLLSIHLLTSLSTVIIYFGFLTILLFYTGYEKSTKMIQVIIKYKNAYIIGSLFFFFIVVLTYVDGTGLNIGGWNTTTLEGPYNLPHKLGYVAMSVVCVLLVLYNHSKNYSWLLLTSLYSGIILLTASRTAILFLVFCLFIFWLNQERKIRLVSLFLCLFVLIVLLMATDVLNPLIDKTIEAYNKGSITNGRARIIMTSLSAFEGKNMFNYLTGVGYEGLLLANKIQSGLAIHAHNDIITILVSFGVINLILFCHILINFMKGPGFVPFVLSLALCFVFNGVFMYSTLVIMLLPIKVFFMDYNLNKGKEVLYE